MPFSVSLQPLFWNFDSALDLSKIFQTGNIDFSQIEPSIQYTIDTNRRNFKIKTTSGRNEERYTRIREGIFKSGIDVVLKGCDIFGQ
jgi:hypothetical protein